MRILIMLIILIGCSTQPNQVSNVQLTNNGHELILTWDNATVVEIEEKRGSQDTWVTIGTIRGTEFKRVVSTFEIQGQPAGECDTFAFRVNGVQSNTVQICNQPTISKQ